MKTSPNSLLAQSSFSLPDQGESMVSTKLTVVTSAPAGVLCQCLSFQIGAKLLYILDNFETRPSQFQKPPQEQCKGNVNSRFS